MSEWWSYLLTVVGVSGLYLAGKKNLWGWAVGLGAQGLWIAYAYATSQPGFYASAVAYGSVYARNLWRWRKEALEERERPEEIPAVKLCPCGHYVAPHPFPGCKTEDLPQFGVYGCTCKAFTRQGGTPRFLNPGETIDKISGWHNYGNCPHHPPQPPDNVKTL